MEESNLILMEEMKNDLHWLMFHCFMFGFTFCLLIWVNWPKKKKTRKSLPDLHCFQCEIEMPVRIKNNNAYCSNCGLHHGEIL